ncbi:MAG: M56 family metallopeptidase [Muribaculaceae bacterium]|nr:M56 family metallopeptidase [Muribaculaceae bacterium]
MLLIYQIKVGLCLIVFYLLWKLLLSRETFHRFNRVALLVVMALALVLPWIRFSLDVSSPITEQMVMLEELIVTPSGTIQPQQATQSWNVLNIATVIYFVGMAMVLAWLLHSRWSLSRLFRKGRTESLPEDITLHVLPEEIAPFSYFRHIVISEQDYRDNPREILVHEKAHINLRHSLDVAFISLVTLFQWWNPAAWLLCRELRQVHEYEADEAVLNEHVDVKQYQMLLIRKSVGDQLFSMANNFNYQSLKKRIRMMTINKSSRWNKLRALAVIPVIALALLAFANPTIESAPEMVVVAYHPASVNAVQPSQPEAVPVAVPAAGEKSVEEQAPEAQPELQDSRTEVYESVDQMPEFPGGEMEMMKYLSQNIKYPENAAKNDIQGRVVLRFVVEKTGEIGEIKVLRSVDEELDAEAVRVVRSMPNFTPGRKNGKAVAVWYALPISFKLQGDPEKPKTE